MKWRKFYAVRDASGGGFLDPPLAIDYGQQTYALSEKEIFDVMS